MSECSRFEDLLTTCFWLRKLTATQPKTYLRRASEAPVEACKLRKQLRAGATAYLTVVVRPRRGAGSRQEIRTRSSPERVSRALVYNSFQLADS